MKTSVLSRFVPFLSRQRRSAAKTNVKVRPRFEALEDRMLMDHALGTVALQQGSADHIRAAAMECDDHDHDHDHDHLHGVYAADYTGYIPEDFVITGKKWAKQTISYSFSNLFDGGMKGISASQMKLAIEEALRLWSSYAPLHFVEVADSGPGVTDNNYDAGNYPLLRFGHHFIDGNGSVLAHAYFPAEGGLPGDTHFDNGDNWTSGLFLEVAIHEIGHALGLDHEKAVNAIMNPSVNNRFSGLGEGYLLQDDVNGIQYLYGSGTGSVTPLGDEEEQGIGVPTPQGPTGTTNDTTPTFAWSSARNATWYYLYVYNNDTGGVATQWVEGQTSHTFSSPLAQGSYTFWVLGWGDGQYGEWSEGMDFRVEAARPETAVLIGPNGTTSETMPTFRWNQANGASWYYLYVYNNDTGRVACTKWVQGQTSYRLGHALTAGNYTFWVQTWGNGMYGKWSEGMDFRVEAAKPGIATLYGPTGSTSTSTPTFQWSSVNGASWYYVYIYNNDTGRVTTQWVQNQTSYQTTSALAQGNYTFWVLAWGNGMYGDWSEGMNFSII